MKIFLSLKYQTAFALLLLSLFIPTPAGHAASKTSDKISAHAEAAKGFATIGEPILCRITVKHAQNIEILNAITEPEAAGLEIKNVQPFNDKEGKFTIIGKTFALSGYKLGDFMVSPVEISYREKGGEVSTLQTNPIYIKIKSIAEGEEKTDIRDVKGVVKLPYKILKYLLPVGIPLLLLLLLALYLLYYRKKELEKINSKPKFTPAEEALRDLHELFESALIRDGYIKQYYLRFSEILRIFLEKQFGIQAAEATTSEIAISCKRLFLIPDDSKKRLIEILETADFAKFAKWVPPPADIIALNKRAEEMILELAEHHQLKRNQNAVS